MNLAGFVEQFVSFTNLPICWLLRGGKGAPCKMNTLASATIIHTSKKCMLYDNHYVAKNVWNAMKMPFIFSSGVHFICGKAYSKITDTEHCWVLISLGRNRNNKSKHIIFKECRKHETLNLQLRFVYHLRHGCRSNSNINYNPVFIWKKKNRRNIRLFSSETPCKFVILNNWKV